MSTLILIYFILQNELLLLLYSHNIKLKTFNVKHNGLQSCTNFCFNGANGESLLKSKCIQSFIGNTKFPCSYKRRKDTINIDKLPLITCICQQPLKYELKFEDNQQRLRQPTKDKILNVLSWNYQYTTLDFVDYKSELVLNGTKSCQNNYLYLPSGWEVAPNDKITLNIIEQYSFNGAHHIILSDFNAYLTKLGRFEAFKRAKDKTLWKQIEGRIVDGNDILMNNNTLKLTLKECKDLCIKNVLCKALQFPYCKLKTSTNTNKLDESFQFSTYIKLNIDSSKGIPLKANPDGLFVKYYDNKYGLKVPDAYCPGRILLRKIRTPLQCENVNGHWYELISFQQLTYNDASFKLNNLYWRGVKGHLAVITSKEEQSCIQQLICDNDNNNIAWIGGEKIGKEYKWMVPDIDEYNLTFIDETENIILGMYAPELTKWKSYQQILTESGNSGNEFYAVSVCNDNEWNWKIENKNNKHYVLIEYETPIKCEESETVFEILGPSMSYYYAEEIASKQTWFGNKGYLGTIMNENEEKCVEKLGFCGIEKIWAAASDNSDNDRPHEWLWKSIYGPSNQFETLFFVNGRPNDKRLNLYSNWDLAYDEPDNLLNNQHHLSICGPHNKTWSDENFHQRFKYLVEYKQMKPLNAPRILQVIGLNGGIQLSFSHPLNDGGSPIIKCRVSVHPIKIKDINSRYYKLNHITFSIHKDIIPKSNKDFQVEHIYFNAINAVKYETELRCANKHGLSPSAIKLKVEPIGPPEKPQKIWIIKSTETNVIIGWQIPFSDGGSQIINYHLQAIAIGRRGANCEKHCNQQYNHIKPPSNYTRLRSEHWDMYFNGILNNNSSIIDVNSTLNALNTNVNINCVDIGFTKFIQSNQKNKDRNLCEPYCWFIQELNCKFIVYKGDNIQNVISKGYINNNQIIDPDSTNIGTYFNIDNIEKIEWTEMNEWISLPKVYHRFIYDTSALNMLRIWGSWNNFNQGIPLHLTPENNGFITWIGLHSGVYHYYFEGARQENGRPFFFTFVDDQFPFTQIWNQDLKQFRDQNFIRIKTRDVIKQPYTIINVNNINQEYFQHQLSGFTPFQQYKFEIWAETLIGNGPSITTNHSIHFTTPKIKSLVLI